MRILFVNHSPLYGSGSGIQARMLAESLQRAGHEVAALAPRYGADLEPPFAYEPVGTPELPGRCDVARPPIARPQADRTRRLQTPHDPIITCEPSTQPVRAARAQFVRR